MDINDIKPGDIFFTCDNSLISKAIRFVETGGKLPLKTIPSHVGIITHISLDKIYIVEASFWGVRASILRLFFKKGVYLWLAHLKPPRHIETGLKWATTQIGVKYDFTALIGIFLKASLRFLPQKIQRWKFIKNYLESKERFFCSEFVEMFSGLTGKRLWYGDESLVTPFDQYRSEQKTIYEEVNF